VNAVTARLGRAANVYWSALGAGWADYRVLYTWKTWLLGWLPRVVCQVAFFGAIGHLLGSKERVEFLLIGSAVSIAVMETLMAMSFMNSERRAGTLALVAVSPASPVLVLAGRTAFLIGTATVSAGIAMTAADLMFRMGMPWGRAWAILLLIASAAVSSHCLALFITGLSMRFLHLGTLLNALVFLPMQAVCGVVVPLDFWPSWVQAVAAGLPLTHGLAAVRAVFDGASPSVALPAVGRELLVAAGWLILATLAFRRFLLQMRKTGSIDHAD
jgi:ABC-2 type transport system permease protein